MTVLRAGVAELVDAPDLGYSFQVWTDYRLWIVHNGGVMRPTALSPPTPELRVLCRKVGDLFI